jgi:NAD(P)-dependent dehydrogenase (short-subunit alcohol dehydrogenase family)
LFLLCRGLEGDLAAAAERGGALVLAATGLGGTLGFGPDELPAGGFAGQGAILGFLKCLGVEWPGVMVRGVDLSPTEPACELAARLLGELADPNGPFEVGYNGARRVTWRPADGPLEPAQDRAIELDSQSVILITGGARGITAAAALELARRRQPRLVLVGRSPVPAAEEAADTASLSGPGPIKSALIERMRREGRTPAPAAIEAAYQSILRDREIRSNQTAIAAAGSAVEFVSADLRDEAAVQSLLEGIKARYGRLDGVIHGAGIIEDRLVRDKSPESLDRVLAAKADSAFHLVRHLDPSGLKFLLFFSSIAGRYGNRGQADYAAANEVLTKLAHHLNRQWTARVAAVDWGPWSEVGMVADLAPHLAARGVLLIPPAIGSAMLADEIEFGPKSDSEVILAGGADKLIEAPRRRGASPALMEVT